MTYEYIPVEDAIDQPGLRMVVVKGVPSPWSEAAKNIFHIKRIPWKAVHLVYDSEALTAWTKQRGAPVAIHDKEQPRSGWAEILLLAERLAPEPSLLPADPQERALALGLSHELCGEGGLGWTRRVQLVHAGLQGAGGFEMQVAKYLATRYGHSPAAGGESGDRVAALLGMFAARLKAQHAAGSPYYLGGAMSCVDVYSAAFMALFAPLPESQCAMKPDTRAAFETLDAQTKAALDAVLLAHRDMMYAKHFELPLSL